MRAIGKLVLAPPVWLLVLVYRLGLMDFVTGGELLAVVPGFVGRWWRETWYRLTLEACGERVSFEWMAVIKSPIAHIGDRVFIGPFSWIGRASIGDDTMLGGHVTILSGSRHHGTERLDIPMAEQPGELTRVEIGRDVWLGNGSVIMADVAEGSVVGAGSVVTQAFAPRLILAGVPAKVIRPRGDNARD